MRFVLQVYWSLEAGSDGSLVMSAGMDATYDGWVAFGFAADSNLQMIGSNVIILKKDATSPTGEKPSHLPSS